MAEIRSERAQSLGTFLGKLVLIILSAEATVFLAQALGVDWHAVPGYAGAVLFAVAMIIMYGVLQGVSNALFYAVSLVTQLAQSLAGTAQELTERLITLVIETAARVAMQLITLPFRLIAICISWLYTTTLAPLVEYRRQRAELRRLYESVKHDYASFDDFVRDFNEGSDSSGQKQKKNTEAPPQPACDPFKDACATLGLPENGTFTEAEFKQRYGTMIRAVHPDIAGRNALATQVNQARDLIRKRKGWQ